MLKKRFIKEITYSESYTIPIKYTPLVSEKYHPEFNILEIRKREI
jgi:hypothetical protein